MDFEAITKLIDSWYKALMVLGGGVFAVALFLPVHGMTNAQALLLAGGSFLLGLGEWKNHKEQSFIKPPNAYTGGAAVIRGTVWKPDALGLLFDGMGILLLIRVLWSIVHTK